MAKESGRRNEFAEDAHYWNKLPIVEDSPDLIWMCEGAINDRLKTNSQSKLKSNLKFVELIKQKSFHKVESIVEEPK